jgi:hypothetical protein
MAKQRRIEFPEKYALAEKIARDLFTDGSGSVSTRLLHVVQESPLRTGVGLCQQAVVDRIYKHMIGDGG